jgi:glycosyltransferase involved in cell wall biosynthesis
LTSSERPFLSLIIPAHNEEHRLPATLERVDNFLHSQTFTSELLVIENGSLDRTAEAADRFARSNPATRVLREPRAGKGLAVRSGMLAARGDYRFICDADLSMPIEEVVRFLPPALTDFDIAIASRETPGAVRFGEPPYRHWIGRGFNTLVRLLAVPGFQDTQCGFKCFSAEAAQALFPIQRLDGWTFDVEVLFLALKLGYRVSEVPIPWYYIRGSQVRLLRDSWQMFVDLFRIRSNWQRGVYSWPAGSKPSVPIREE